MFKIGLWFRDNAQWLLLKGPQGERGKDQLALTDVHWKHWQAIIFDILMQWEETVTFLRYSEIAGVNPPLQICWCQNTILTIECEKKQIIYFLL